MKPPVSIAILGYGFMGRTHASVYRMMPSARVAAEMIPPVPFYKHCPEVLLHNTSRAMDAIFKS